MALNRNQGGGYVYQYYLTILLEFAIRQGLFTHYLAVSNTFDTASKKIVEDLINFNKLFFSSENHSVDVSFDLLLEGHWKCFQDINYIFNIGSDTFCTFIQSKGSKLQDNSRFRTKFIDIIFKFADNINISRSTYSLVVVHNRITPPWAQGFKRRSKSQTDNHYLVELIISLLQKEEDYIKKKVIKLLTRKRTGGSFLQGILLEYCRTSDLAKLVPIGNPLIMRRVELYKSILERTFLLDDFQYPYMLSVINNYLASGVIGFSLAELYHKYSILSTDNSPIYAIDPEYAKYLSYGNLYFSPDGGGKIARDLSFVSEGKFVY